jgi:site-specific DNA recombinase
VLDRKFVPTLSYRYATYGRMSDPKQNKRSPDQQFDTIAELILRLCFPWLAVASYRDDGISGRYIRKRPGLQRLLRDIEAGLIVIDLIIVDTLERLGRADEIAELRRRLDVDYGILVVAADNNFSDPTGIVGQAVGMVEQIRSTENTRISGHNVTRGKKDAARRRRWPGGPPPFGYQLKAIVNESVNPPEVYNVLEPEPAQRDAMVLAFERADQTGEGAPLMSQWWNDSPKIPARFKPISSFTMAYRLKNRIAIGILVWGKNRTGVVNDTRVVEPNPDGPELIPDFCTPLVPVDLFERVQQLFQARSARVEEQRRPATDADSPAKLITPQARGLTLKYLLTGLARCGSCRASMRPVQSGTETQGGKMYVYYSCPGHYDGSCENRHHVPEDRLRAAVIDRLRARFFPAPERQGQTPAWFPQLLEMVHTERQRHRDEQPDRAADDAREIIALDRQLDGWMLTLSDPTLTPEVRTDFIACYQQAKRRRHQLDRSIAAARALGAHAGRTLDPGQLIGQLRDLANVLAGFNPTLGNLELSRHIERIDCFADGRVEMRGTFLGLFEGATELLTRDVPVPAVGPETTANRFAPVVPRRRGRLQVPNLSADATTDTDIGGGDTSLDPKRFAGLPESFIWTESLVIEKTLSWAQANAAKVVRLRLSGLTMEEVAKRCGKTIPTIRDALKHGKAAQPGLELPRKAARARWAEDHAAEVMALKLGGMTTDQLAGRFGKSDTTIRAAVAHAEATAELDSGATDDRAPARDDDEDR